MPLRRTLNSVGKVDDSKSGGTLFESRNKPSGNKK